VYDSASWRKVLSGSSYSETHSQAELIKQQIYAIFDTHSQAEAQARYLELLKLKLPLIKAFPASLAIFDFLEHHWPKLDNAIGSHTIPTTNNTN
jgi:hypothetical protein